MEWNESVGSHFLEDWPVMGTLGLILRQQTHTAKGSAGIPQNSVSFSMLTGVTCLETCLHFKTPT